MHVPVYNSGMCVWGNLNCIWTKSWCKNKNILEIKTLMPSFLPKMHKNHHQMTNISIDIIVFENAEMNWHSLCSLSPSLAFSEMGAENGWHKFQFAIESLLENIMLQQLTLVKISHLDSSIIVEDWPIFTNLCNWASECDSTKIE